MSSLAGRLLKLLARSAGLLFAAILGTIFLVQRAPGYYSDVRELDPTGGASIRESLEQARSRDIGLLPVALQWLKHAARGDFGRSRQFDVPVAVLLKERARISVLLLSSGTLLGWSGACCLGMLTAGVRKHGLETLVLVPSSWLLVLPVGALATLCFLMDSGGPILVIAMLIGARELQFFCRLLHATLDSSHFLYLRAAGIRQSRILWSCALPQLAPQLASLLLRSLLIAIAMLVPIEVVFDVPGLGQLAWSATMNRDLPVLMAATLVFAGALVAGGALADAAAEAQQA